VSFSFVPSAFNFRENERSIRQFGGVFHTNAFCKWKGLSIYDIRFSWKRAFIYGFSGEPFRPSTEQFVLYAILQNKDIGKILSPKSKEKAIMEVLSKRPPTIKMYHRVYHKIYMLRSRLVYANSSKRAIDVDQPIITWVHDCLRPFPGQIRDTECLQIIIQELDSLLKVLQEHQK
jgi:hypothetical protein